MENDPDIVAMVAASAALTLSGVPFLGPIGAARVGYVDGKYILNPMVDEMPETSLDLVVAGTTDAVLMVESEASELPEDVMLGAVMYGHTRFQPVIEAIVKLAEVAAKEPWELKTVDNSETVAKVSELAGAGLRDAYAIVAKQERRDAIAQVKEKVVAELVPEDDDGARRLVARAEAGGTARSARAHRPAEHGRPGGHALHRHHMPRSR